MFQIGDTINWTSTFPNSRGRMLVGTILTVEGTRHAVEFRAEHNEGTRFKALVEASEMSLVTAAPRPATSSGFDSSGLGLGGAGSHDLRAEMLDLIASGQMRVRDAVCPWNGSRYDENCAVCRRITMICNDCERCERCHP